MKFMRIGDRGCEVPAVLHEGEYFDLRPVTADIEGNFLSREPVARAVEALRAGLLHPLSGAKDARVGSPIARPGAVICVGLNYAAHAAESGVRPPDEPVIFLKTPNTVTGPYDDVTIPRGSAKSDWEVELGVIIGRETSYLDHPDEASASIAGFVAVNDVSERSFQLEVSGGQWSKGKCAAGFTPTGPWLVTPDEIDPGSLALESRVGGEIRQLSSTQDMIFSVPYILWHLSQFMVLEPGDLILTGTPEGVALSGRFPYLRPGDRVDIEVAGLGRQSQRFVEWSR